MGIENSGIRDHGPFRRAGLKEYIARMSKPSNHIIFDDNVAKVLSAQGIEWEEDPRSIYDPQQLWDALGRYGSVNHCRFKFDPAIVAGIKLAKRIFGKHGDNLVPITDFEELKSALKLTKSSGLPLMTSKLESLTYSLDREEQVRKGFKKPNPCIAYKRTQRNNKTRLVWGYPLEMTIMEARFARPLISRFLDSRTTMAFGLQKFELGTFLKYNLRMYKHILCLDYSKFDSSISASLIATSFGILSTWFSEADMKEFGWNEIVRYFIHTPIVMPDGHLYCGKDHGVPSGSYFTQLIDSIVNTILIGAIGYAFKEQTHWRSVFVLGDDCIFGVDRKLNLETVSRFLSRYGITLNIEKSDFDVMYFLGAYWESGFPDNDTSELAAKAVFPETFRKYPENLTSAERAQLVLSSYASQYKSAWKFLPNRFPIIQIEYESLNFRPEYLSGSDKYHWEVELRARGRPLSRAVPPFVSLRFLK